MLHKGLSGITALAVLGFGLASTGVVAGDCASSQKGKDIVETAIEAGDFNTLVKAVKAAGLVETLRSPGPFTVFAPTDEAFEKLPENGCQVFIGRGNGHDVKIFHQHIQHIGRDERRQAGSQADVFYPQVQE